MFGAFALGLVLGALAHRYFTWRNTVVGSRVVGLQPLAIDPIASRPVTPLPKLSESVSDSDSTVSTNDADLRKLARAQFQLIKRQDGKSR